MSIGRIWGSVAILALCAFGVGCQAGATVESTVTTTASTSDRVTSTSASPPPPVTSSASVQRELGAQGLTVAVVGDWYADDPDEGRYVEDAEQTRDAIIAAAPALVLGLGDFSYAESPDSFFAFAAPLEATIPIYPTYGNHDGVSKGEVTCPNFYRELRDHFLIHDEWYSFDVGPVHFISINSEYPFGTAEFDLQFEDISTDLAAAYADDEVRMIIPFFHRAMVNPLSQNGPDWTLQEIVHPILDRYSSKIPLALQAHHHIYTRTHAVGYSEERDADRCQDAVGGTICESVPLLVDTGSGASPVVYRPTGIVFVTVGTGGAYATGLTPDAPYMATRIKPSSVMDTDGEAGTFGYLRLMVAEDARSVEGEYRANNGDVLDWFRIEMS